MEYSGKIMNANCLYQTIPSADAEPLFSLGRGVSKPGALDLLDRAGISATAYLTRHQTRNFGTLSPPDLHENHVAITYGQQIFSAYDIGHERLWVIKEADRSSTTLSLPSEY
jgi:hypothetical protein